MAGRLGGITCWSIAHCIVVALVSLGPSSAQVPVIFDVSTVVVGQQRLETRWVQAHGKWTDDGPDEGPLSTEVHCYQRLGFCEIAHARTVLRKSTVMLDTFDILRWNTMEMIAVDSSPVCVVNTLRIDFARRQVSMSSTSKGKADNKICGQLTPDLLATAFLGGGEESPRKTK